MTKEKLEFAPINPPIVGYWVLGDSCHLAMPTKPTDEQIKNTEELLGWRWKDNTK